MCEIDRSQVNGYALFINGEFFDVYETLFILYEYHKENRCMNFCHDGAVEDCFNFGSHSIKDDHGDILTIKQCTMHLHVD